MTTNSRYLEAPRRLRAFVRAQETSLVALAAVVGVMGGLVVAAMSAAVELLHILLFKINSGDRLSSQVSIGSTSRAGRMRASSRKAMPRRNPPRLGTRSARRGSIET